MTNEQKRERLEALRRAILLELSTGGLDGKALPHGVERGRLEEKLRRVDDKLFKLSVTFTVWGRPNKEESGNDRLTKKELAATVVGFITLMAAASVIVHVVFPTAPLVVILSVGLLIAGLVLATVLVLILGLQEAEEREFYRELTEAEKAERKKAKG